MAPAPTTRIRMGLSLLLLLLSMAVYLSRHCERSEAIRNAATITFCRWGMRRLPSRHHLLDLAQLLLAEEHLVADEEGRRAERAARDRGLGVLDQLGLDVGILRAREQLCAVEAGCGQRLRRDFEVVHLLRLPPHVMECSLDIF